MLLCLAVPCWGPQHHQDRRGDQEGGGQRRGADGDQPQQSQVYHTHQVGGPFQVGPLDK